MKAEPHISFMISRGRVINPALASASLLSELTKVRFGHIYNVPRLS